MAKKEVEFSVKTNGRNPAVTIDRLTPVDTDNLPKRINFIRVRNNIGKGKESLEKGKWHGLIWRVAGAPGDSFEMKIKNVTQPRGQKIRGTVGAERFAAGFAIFKVKTR